MKRTPESALFLLIAAGATAVSTASADVRLPNVIGDNMVLQRGMKIPVWGWASPGERVTVELARAKARARADERGEWRVDLPKMRAGGPHTLTVSGANTVELKNILVGEVWIGSGQSNMEFALLHSDGGPAEVDAANYADIRLFQVPKGLSGIPKADVEAAWQPCTPQSVPLFSAVLYYFGKRLHGELDVPVGLIAAAWGGTCIEPWTPPPGFARVERLAYLSDGIRREQLAYLDQVEELLKQSEEGLAGVREWLTPARTAALSDALLPPAPPVVLPEHTLAIRGKPAGMFNAMIHPLVPFAGRGVIWYQGESNIFDGSLYAYKMRALVEGWRNAWHNHRLSFYWAQLAPCWYGGDTSRLPLIWEAQTFAMRTPRTGMAVLTDIGNIRDIHPRNKKDVGERLALWALAHDYGKDIVYSGPLFKSMKVEGSAIRVFFDHSGAGLQSRDGNPLTHFEIAGNGGYVPAKAVIDPATSSGLAADTVLVSSDAIAEPEAVRFAWDEAAVPNLCNKEGLPAGPFRTCSTAPIIRGSPHFVDTTSVTLECVEMEGVIRYTLDGSTPTKKSPIYRQEVSLNDTATVRARYFRAGGEKSTVVQQTFTRVEPRERHGMMVVPGLRYDYYEGAWNKLPDFSELEPAASGIADGVTLMPRRSNDCFGFSFTGYLEVRAAGPYTFRLGSDDGSRLSVDGRLVVDNDGLHPYAERSGTVDLDPGMREIVITFFERGGGEALTATCEGPGVSRGPMTFWCEP